MRTHEGTTKEGKEKGAVTPLNQRPDGAATRSDRNCDVDERSYGVEGMDVNNIKTWLKKHSDNISALDRNMHHDSEFISMLMNNLSVKIESSHAQHSEAIGALGQENEQLLSDVKSMKTERDMIRREMKEINKTLEKLETDNMEAERMLEEAEDVISKLDAEMETSKKSSADTIAGLSSKHAKQVKKLKS
ncbi:leucine-rich repeat and coiled-coil domain-containing protein 1-like [Vigna unguiculata]|uniref:leucine-rich repeat and coiled-coil domain-containing protein 1-like n=1 Tax=Vigna unguiculata TaxID=3917 RepID=UPI0010163568|nr:leucine-rich repeat and coiled-coil domain-containing protein 1-like [Vigna unguiculata]XP_027926109.1 leucine-rich repeat and coiled-coil domain-containing protein 1-like [Vigna unguiculata]